MVSQGLRSLLATEKDIVIVGQAENGRSAVAMARELRPDVIVMDVAMPLMNGLEATRQIVKELPSIKVIILSAHGDDAYMERASVFGASGYLLKQSTVQVLARTIREVHQGGTCFTPSAARRVKEPGAKPARGGANPSEGFCKLTLREAEVLQLIAEGKANKQTAAELGVSLKTVEKHRDNLMRKLGIHDTAGLTRYAIASGAIESSVQSTIQ